MGHFSEYFLISPNGPLTFCFQFPETFLEVILRAFRALSGRTTWAVPGL